MKKCFFVPNFSPTSVFLYCFSLVIIFFIFFIIFLQFSSLIFLFFLNLLLLLFNTNRIYLCFLFFFFYTLNYVSFFFINIFYVFFHFSFNIMLVFFCLFKNSLCFYAQLEEKWLFSWHWTFLKNFFFLWSGEGDGKFGEISHFPIFFKTYFQLIIWSTFDK